MSDKLMALFEQTYEYPREQIAEFGGVPEDTLYDYVSSTFLDGLINYVNPIKAYCLERYSEDWVETLTNIERFKEQTHSNIHNIGDDVYILADTDKDYWIFYYDCDCSDCMVGRFSKELVDSRQEVEEIFLTNLKGQLENRKTSRYTELNLSGWIHFA